MTRHLARGVQIGFVVALLAAHVATLVATPRAEGPHGQSAPGNNPPATQTIVSPEIAGDLFLPAANYSTDGSDAIFYGNSTWVAAADLNGDGRPDLVVANWCSSYQLNVCMGTLVAVLLSNGDGTFQPAVTYSTGGYYGFSVIAADVNGDGKLDLLVANGCPVNVGAICPANSSVGVLLGNGDGTFQAVKNYSSGAQLSWMAVADVNGDGKPDLLLANRDGGANGAGSVGVLLGNGDGSFQAVQTYASGGSGTDFIAVADMNGDGKPDLLVSNSSGCNDCEGGVGVLLGNGDGTFQPVIVSALVASANEMAVADLNGDGKPDLVVNGGGSFGGGAVSVLLGNGDGTFQPAVVYPSGGQYNTNPIVLDLNADHKLDIAVANNQFCTETGQSACVGVLLGNGDGTFQPAQQYGVGGAASLTAADVNGDGKIDLLTADECGLSGFCGHGDGVVDVLLGYGDGTFEAATTYDAGAHWTTWVGTADLTGNGRLDAVAVSPNEGSIDGSVGILMNRLPAAAPTTTALASALNPSVYGQAVNFTATVSAPGVTPTGTVIFFDGLTTTLGSASAANGMAYLKVASLATGAHAITAAYQGSDSAGPSRSVAVSQVVTAANTSTAVSAENPARVNLALRYTAKVTSQYGGAATGTVSFQDNGVPVATVTLKNNRALYNTSYSTRGVHSIVATYSGDANHGGSVSPVLMESIFDPSSTTLATSGSPSIFGQAVTFTASVKSQFGAIPDGETVTFYDGSDEIGSAATAAGMAMLTTGSLKAGTHSIKANYAGDGTFKPSSGTVKQVVSP